MRTSFIVSFYYLTIFSIPGPPLTSESAIEKLLAHNVTVGLGIEENWQARNARFDIAWAAIESGGNINKDTAIALVSSNLEELLGLDVETEPELVAYQGGDILDFHSKVVAVVSPKRGHVDLF